MTSRVFRVVGALGRGPASPLLAEILVEDQVVDRVVLGRPADPAVAARVRGLGASALVVEREVVETNRGRWGVTPLVVGADVMQLRESLGAPWPEGAALALARRVVGHLRRLHDAGLGHGALDAGCLRLEPGARVQVLGARGGHESDDVRALVDIIEELVATDAEGVPDRVRALLEAELDDLASLAEALGPARAEDTRALADLAVPAEVEVVPHALTGAILAPEGEGGGSPPRVQIAAIGALTLVLGLGAGWALAGWGVAAPPEPEVVVPGATEVRLDCDPQVQGGERLGIDAPRVCRVIATMQDGTTATGDLDGSPLGRYQCVRGDGGLRCSER